MGIMEACGLKAKEDLRGDCVLSRYADNDDDIWKRIDLSVADCSSDAAWVRESAKLNAGRTSGGSSLSGILGQQADQMARQMGGQGDGAAPSADAAPNLGSACSYTQTPSEVEVVAPMPEGATKKDVKVKFSSTRLDLSFVGSDDKALKGLLGGAVDLDGCTWTIDNGSVVITMEKKEEGKEWPFALKAD
mmetsp:Transcript_21188/g.47817  ORF Transcript_21188/g.47817 Transcript_21188/m.47817 type:complete len:190 (-) Transcript_21188:140-709(-)